MSRYPYTIFEIERFSNTGKRKTCPSCGNFAYFKNDEEYLYLGCFECKLQVKLMKSQYSVHLDEITLPLLREAWNRTTFEGNL